MRVRVHGSWRRNGLGGRTRYGWSTPQGFQPMIARTWIYRSQPRRQWIALQFKPIGDMPRFVRVRCGWNWRHVAECIRRGWPR